MAYRSRRRRRRGNSARKRYPSRRNHRQLRSIVGDRF